jgi:hypothetical protein
LDEERLVRHPFLNEMVRPGHVLITSNWDPLIEYFASLKGYPLRLASRARHFEPTEVYVIKLHGSVDWTQADTARRQYYSIEELATLRELQFATNVRRHSLPSRRTDGASVVRVRSLPMSIAWQRVRSRTRQPYMVTMATGKSDDLGPLREVWRDAYRALSRAETLDIVGYSMPSDDVEIRTMLRTGIQRGSTAPRLTVVNPAPDVHYRVRNLLDRDAESDYLAVAPY